MERFRVRKQSLSTPSGATVKKFRLAAKGLLARIIQHEVDHLDGKVFLDRMSSMKKLMSREAYLGLSGR